MSMPGTTGSDLDPPATSSWLENEDQAFLLKFYEEQKLENGLLPKEAVNPFNLTPLLPSLLLLELRPCQNWRFSLVGTGIAEFYKDDFTGERLIDLPYEACKAVYENMVETAAEHGKPSVCFGKLRYPDRDFLSTAKSVYPVSTDGETVTHCLILLSVVDKSESLQFLYDPHGPSTGHDKLYIAEASGASGWSLAAHKDIRFAATEDA